MRDTYATRELPILNGLAVLAKLRSFANLISPDSIAGAPKPDDLLKINSVQVVYKLRHRAVIDKDAGYRVLDDLMFGIQTHGLCKSFGKKGLVLNSLSLSVPSGTVFALLGSNGAGKTTTVRLLSTLSVPTAGTAIVGGFDIVREPDLVRTTIGCVFQYNGVDPEMSGLENLLLQGRLHGMKETYLKERAYSLLERFQLTKVAKQPVKTFSGGMQRKLDISLGILHKPRVLFLDEPTTGLDPQSRIELWKELRQLVSEEQLTVLLTTHYLEEADQLATRIGILREGCLVVEGAPEELKLQAYNDVLELGLNKPDYETLVRKDIFRDFAGLARLEISPYRYKLFLSGGPKAISAAITLVHSEGICPVDIILKKPSLDDLYLLHATEK